MAPIIVLLAVATAVFAWLAVIYIIPATRVSSYRTKLWNVRDELVDAAMRDPELRTAAVDELVTDIERRIKHARELTPFAILTLGLPAKKAGIAGRPRNEPVLQADLDFLHPYKRRIENADIIHLFTGSPSGWVALGLFVPIVATGTAIRACRRSGRANGDHHVGQEAKDLSRELIAPRLRETIRGQAWDRSSGDIAACV